MAGSGQHGVYEDRDGGDAAVMLSLICGCLIGCSVADTRIRLSSLMPRKACQRDTTRIMCLWMCLFQAGRAYSGEDDDIANKDFRGWSQAMEAVAAGACQTDAGLVSVMAPNFCDCRI